jgi:hypothetical protein
LSFPLKLFILLTLKERRRVFLSHQEREALQFANHSSPLIIYGGFLSSHAG